MKTIPYILIYLFLTLAEVFPLLRKKQKKQIIVYIMIMLVSLTLTINIAVGTNIPSIASVTRKLLLPILRRIQEM
jgi:hypothetical protein